MTIVDEFRNNTARVLDRLVDGELGTQERVALLAALDDEPAGWRQCALAFLEAQSWGWQLSRVASEPILAQVTAPARAVSPHRGLGWLTALAVAASMLVAFAIGTRYPFERAGSGLEAPQVTRRDDALGARNEPLSPGAAAREKAPFTLTLTPLDGGDGEPIELPVLESDAGGDVSAAANRAALSRALVQRFEQDGFEVDRQQQLWPVDLPDGRRVVVPIEEVDIRAPSIERL